MQGYVLVVEGLDGLFDPESLDARIVQNAVRAINKTAARTRTRSDRDMRQRIMFPARYLSNRLRVSRTASRSSLEAVITGRDSPTSLARFSATRNPKAARKAGGVTVTVAPGSTKFMRNAFLLPLRGGNLGLATRLKPGESLNKRYMRRMNNGLYLLYGPSVDQVFRNVADNETDEALDYLEREFVRLMDL